MQSQSDLLLYRSHHHEHVLTYLLEVIQLLRQGYLQCACDCFTAVLPDNQLMVVGGMTGRYGSAITDTVEVANTIDV